MNDSVVDITQYKYDQAEKDLRMKLVEYSEQPEVQSQIGEAFYIWKDDPDFLAKEVTEEQVDDLTFEKFFDWFLYDFKFLDSQERVIERFYREKKESLSELEDSIIRVWLDNRYGFFEVEQVVLGESCKIRDLFTKTQYTVLDQASSRKIKRSDIIGARPLATGPNYYFSGVISVYPATFKSIIKEFINNEVKEYRQAFGKDKTVGDYLKDWGFQVGHYLEDLADNPQFVTPEGDEFVLASAVYKLTDRDKTVGKIGEIKSIKEISGEKDEIQVFSWEKRGKNKITGTLEIENDRLRIECYSIRMLEQAKLKIEKELKGEIEHLEDITKESDKFIGKSKDEKYRIDKLPPGAKSRKEVEKTLDDYYTEWIDRPHSSLKGKTPREATKTPEGRNRLNLVLNELETLYNNARQLGEPYYDLEKIKKELDLK